MRVGAAVRAASGALLLAACSSTMVPVPTTTTAEPATSAPTTTVDDTPSTVRWGPCPEVDSTVVECGRIEVPLDHGDPSAGVIEMAVARVPASRPDPLGVLLLNPGGPGASGVRMVTDIVDVWALFFAEFDVIGFDPRGAGGSTPVSCPGDPDDESVEYLLDDGEDPSAMVDLLLAEAADCLSSSSDLALHVGTNNAARDMDVLREELGEEQITYLGYSYGSRLGAVYAALFPDRVRAMVLDGPVAPDEYPSALSPIQGEGFEAAWDRFAASCDADPECPLRALGGAEAAFAAADARMSEGTVSAGSDRSLNRAEFLFGTLSALYSPLTWTDLFAGLVEILEEGRGTFHQQLVDDMIGRREDGTYDNSNAVNFLVNCADDPVRPPLDDMVAGADALADRFPHFGPLFRADIGCSGLPAALDPLHVGPADLAVPALIIALEGDPATPIAWARGLADSMGAAVVITSDGDGHGAFLANSMCVTRVVNNYLVDLEVPVDGWSCSDLDG